MGFLSSLLPAVVGVALAPETGGASLGLTEAWEAPALVGGLTALGTGSLGKGIMAGLGAYGGTQLASGLAGLGTSEAGANISSAAEAQAQEELQKQIALRNAQIEAAKRVGGYEMMDPLQALSQAEKQNIYETAWQNYQPTAAQQAMEKNPMAGLNALMGPDGLSKLKDVGGGSWTGLAKLGAMAAAPAAPDIAQKLVQQPGLNVPTMTQTPNPVYKYNRGTASPFPQPDPYGIEQTYFPTAGYTRMAEGGATPYIQGSPAQGSIEHMSNENAVGANTGYPQAGISQGAYATPWQTPISRNVLEGDADTGVNPISGEMNFANGGLSNLGGYSDGGRLLRGPGDGVSDSIPAVIGNKQPARLADGEFVVPARVVSELGNGSTEAGARKLYAMMDRVQKARAKTTGKGKIAKNTKADRYLPA